MPDARVIVVGGGASGLSAAGALTRLGIEPIVLDQAAAIGDSWDLRYDRLRLHTIRELSGLAHFPIPNRYPRYLSRTDFAEYLREYARQFALKIVSGTTVRAIRTNAGARGQWRIETANRSDLDCDAVVVAHRTVSRAYRHALARWRHVRRPVHTFKPLQEPATLRRPASSSDRSREQRR